MDLFLKIFYFFLEILETLKYIIESLEYHSQHCETLWIRHNRIVADKADVIPARVDRIAASVNDAACSGPRRRVLHWHVSQV